MSRGATGSLLKAKLVKPDAAGVLVPLPPRTSNLNACGEPVEPVGSGG